MIPTHVVRIADAILYEGYVLYPYRPSLKNRQRWTFGGLYPESYCQCGGGEVASNQTECLVEGTPDTVVDVTVRFLHQTDRHVGEIIPPLSSWPEEEPAIQPVESLSVGGSVLHNWQEAEPREIRVAEVSLGQLCDRSVCQSFTLPAKRWLEPVIGTKGEIVGALLRQQQAVEGTVEQSAVEVAKGLFRLTLRVYNRTPLTEETSIRHDEALARALLSPHAVLCVRRGEFVSLLEPPDVWCEQAAGCLNVGTWPVLAGEAGRRDTMLSPPIILYDYPQVAPESHGDLFDGTEIDEILHLRILTLTDEEKQQMAGVDEHVRALLMRTESLGPEQMAGLHGTLRGLRMVSREEAP